MSEILSEEEFEKGLRRVSRSPDEINRLSAEDFSFIRAQTLKLIASYRALQAQVRELEGFRTLAQGNAESLARTCSELQQAQARITQLEAEIVRLKAKWEERRANLIEHYQQRITHLEGDRRHHLASLMQLLRMIGKHSEQQEGWEKSVVHKAQHLIELAGHDAAQHALAPEQEAQDGS
jgi:chromosome segregation ATPase